MVLRILILMKNSEYWVIIIKFFLVENGDIINNFVGLIFMFFSFDFFFINII